MRIGDVKTLLTKTLGAGRPTLLTGAPGVGKSDIVAEVAANLDADVILSHPVVSDPTDAKGLPWVASDKESATFLPFGDLHRAITAKQKTIWFLDDLGQASPAVQAAYMQLLLARRVNGHVLPECVTFAAATNRRADKAGVQGILEPVKSRFSTIIEVEANLEDWCEWATKKNITPEVVGFLRFRPDLLSAFAPSAEMTNSPTPRTWKNAADIISLNLPVSLEFEGIAGAVGKGPATEFAAFLKTHRALPDIESVLKNPEKAPIPTKPDALFAISTSLAYRANAETFEAITKYAERLTEKQKGEFAVLMLRDSIRRDPSLCKTAAFKKLDKGALATLILD